MGWQQHVAVRIGGGESGALEELYERMAGSVYRIAVVMTSSLAAAEQVTEAVFLEAWQRPHVLLCHQHQLVDYLIHQACQQSALWLAQHRTDHPRQASRVCGHADLAARVWCHTVAPGPSAAGRPSNRKP